jgi:hypothetical protein
VAGPDVLLSLSPSAGVPAWLRARPYFHANTLRWLNIHRRYRFLLPAGAVLLLAAVGLLALPIVGHLLEIAAQHPFTPFAILGAACAIATAHRKANIRRSLVDSWLAPLAAPPSVLPRLLLPPLLQILLLGLAIAIPLATGVLSRARAVTLWFTVGAAYLAGSLIGWFSHSNKTASAPAFHYVAIRKPRENWAHAPRLEPLSYWAVAQARVIANPKVAARILLLLLMAIPMETHSLIGQKAIAIAAAGWVLLYVVSLFIATTHVAFKAARWLAPTTLRYTRFAAVLGYRVLLAQLWVWGWVVFLTYAAALPGALRIGLPLSLLFLLLSCAVTLAASWVAMRSVGMRS